MRQLRSILLACAIGFVIATMFYNALPARGNPYQSTVSATASLTPTSTAINLPTQTNTPPPLKSQKYVHDLSLLTGQPCAAPCYDRITPGKTTFVDAIARIKANKSFSNVQTTNNPDAASWPTEAGQECCQLSANDAGIVNAILVKIAPNITTGQVIATYGHPTYVNAVDYTDQEVAMALIFPKIGLVVWTTPGDITSNLVKTSPIVMALYLDPKDWPIVMDTATLQGWNGYLPYRVYRDATPVVTPRVTVTPTSEDFNSFTSTPTP